MQNGTTTLEDSLAVSYKVNIVLPSSPVQHSRSYVFTELIWNFVYTKPCTWILLIAALVTIAKTGSNQDVLQ